MTVRGVLWGAFIAHMSRSPAVAEVSVDPTRITGCGGVGERFLVGLGGSPSGEQLLEETRELAIAANGTWIAVHVETPYVLPAQDQQRLDAQLTLARERGAEIVITRDLEIASALLRVAREQNATDIVIGRSPLRRFGPSTTERLVRDSGRLIVHVVPVMGERGSRLRWKLALARPMHAGEYALAIALIAGVTAAGLTLPVISHISLGLIYLLAVILLSARVGPGPLFLAALLSGLVWEYVFIPPRFKIAIATADDALLWGTYLLVAGVTAQLTWRIRAQARNERLREERATALLQLTRVLAEAPTFDDAVAASLRQIDALFGAASALALQERGDHALRTHPASGYHLDATEREAAEWAGAHAQPAGRFTKNAAGAQGYYLPLQLEHGPIGVLGVKIPTDETLVLGQRDLIEAFARQLALLVEREELRAASEREKLLAASEKLHRSLLDSVSHELRTPLAVIDAAVDGLTDAGDAARAKLVDEIRIAAKRLNRLVRNLLDQTRLETGALKPRLDWCNPLDLVNAAVTGTKDALVGRPLEIAVPDDLPPVRADFALTEHALMNLLLNAAIHTPAGSAIAVSAAVQADRAIFAVADRGPGISANLRDRLFRRFARGEGARAGGLGLGLSIVRGLIRAQGGEVDLGENPGGGTIVTLQLPHRPVREEPAHE